MKGGVNMRLVKVISDVNQKEFESELNIALQKGTVVDVKFTTTIDERGIILYSALVLYSCIYVGED